MIALAAGLALALAAPADLAPRPPATPHAEERTRCAACHSPEGWTQVTFDHARTGFPLEGAHRQAACRGCHRESDFKLPVPRACVACHRDAHAGRMGTRCADCHDAVAWNQPTFGPEAHRRTDFPLDGRHGVLPCEECHADRRDRSFSRAARRCQDCHQADLARAAVVAFDHAVAFGNADDCRRCHGAWSFSPGYLPGHDACFPIRSGAHAGVKCLACHTSIPVPVAVSGCNSLTAACFRCHSCAENAGNHGGVGGYSSQCPVPDSCYGCHGSSFGGN